MSNNQSEPMSPTSAELLAFVRARQSKARWRKDFEAMRSWEAAEGAIIEALVAENGGDFL
jgi:hypothetical protein